MATNSVKYKDIGGRDGFLDQLIRFYDGEVSTETGTWVSMAGVESLYLTVEGITTGTVQVWGINPTVKDDGSLDALPSDETGAHQIGSDITADGVVKFEKQDLPAYIKLKITAAGDIALDAVGRARRVLKPRIVG